MRRDVQEIFRNTPHEKQVMMFSATLSKEIRPVCKKFMQDVISPLDYPRTFLIALASFIRDLLASLPPSALDHIFCHLLGISSSLVYFVCYVYHESRLSYITTCKADINLGYRLSQFLFHR